MVGLFLFWKYQYIDRFFNKGCNYTVNIMIYIYICIHYTFIYKHWYPISIFCKPGFFIEFCTAFPNMHTQLGVYVLLRQFLGFRYPPGKLCSLFPIWSLQNAAPKPGGNPYNPKDQRLDPPMEGWVWTCFFAGFFVLVLKMTPGLWGGNRIFGER